MVGEAGFVLLHATSALLGSLPWVWNKKIVLKHSRRGFVMLIRAVLASGGSSKPSNGLKGNFPHYRYHDMVDSTHRMVTEGLKVAHLRLVIGSSLGCMHSFMWAEMYPDMMDGMVGLSCQPVEIGGR